MASGNQLLEEIFCWIQQTESCAEQLRTLARELESIREDCNTGNFVGSLFSVVGATCLVGAAFATGGAALPALGVLGIASTGAGITVSVVSGLKEHLSSSDTMKKAKKAEEKSRKNLERIQELFQQMTEEVKSSDPDEMDRHVRRKILKAMVRQRGVGLKQMDGVSRILTQFSSNTCSLLAGLNVLKSIASPTYIEPGLDLVKLGLKTGVRSGTKALAVVGLAVSVCELIHSCEKQINNNHVTDASQSLRNAARDMLQISSTLKTPLDSIREMLDEMARQEHEEEDEDEPARPKPVFRFMLLQQNQDPGAKSQTRQRKQGKPRGGRTQPNKGRRETGGQQKKEAGSGQQGGGHQGGGGRDDEDQGSDSEAEESDSETEESSSETEESDSETEESDSEEETSDDERRQKRRQKNRAKRRQTEPCVCVDESQMAPGELKMALCNARSVNNKTSKISDIITDNRLHVHAITETWGQNHNADTVLRRATPENYGFCHQVRNYTVREGRRGGVGGGVALQFMLELQGEQIDFGRMTTFEYVATLLHHDEWAEPVLMIAVYHTRARNLTQFYEFLDEFEMFMFEVFWTHNSVIVLGDFNIWVDRERQTQTQRFDALLREYDLTQNVQQATHRAGHWLDLVISRHVVIQHLCVHDEGISDHYIIYFIARPESEETEEERMKRLEEKE